MIAVTFATAAGLPLWLLPLCGFYSFTVLLYRCRGQWTPEGRFGAANTVSVLRLCGMLVLPSLTPTQIFYAGVILLVMDGVDGWIARRTGLAGEFGEFIDKESDAYFTLILCLLLYRLPSGFGAWILATGLLRYGFVLFIKFAKPPEQKERSSAMACWISVFMFLILLVSFLAYPGYLEYCRVPAALMTLLLVYSFAVSVHQMYRAPVLREKT